MPSALTQLRIVETFPKRVIFATINDLKFFALSKMMKFMIKKFTV